MTFMFCRIGKNKLTNSISQAVEAIHPLFRLQCEWLCWDLLCVHIDFPSEKGKLPYKHIFSWKPLLVERTSLEQSRLE